MKFRPCSCWPPRCWHSEGCGGLEFFMAPFLQSTHHPQAGWARACAPAAWVRAPNRMPLWDGTSMAPGGYFRGEPPRGVRLGSRLCQRLHVADFLSREGGNELVSRGPVNSFVAVRTRTCPGVSARRSRLLYRTAQSIVPKEIYQQVQCCVRQPEESPQSAG